MSETVDPMQRQLISYFKAGYPLLYMTTAEEPRAEVEILAAANATGREQILVWSHTEGLYNAVKPDTFKKEELADPTKLMKFLRAERAKKTIYILRDLHAFLNVPLVVRSLRDLARDLKQLQSTVIILSPVSKLPLELHRDAVVIELELPKRDHIAMTLGRLLTSNAANIKKAGLSISDDEQEKIIGAAMGLTSTEAENAFSKAIVEAVAFNAGRISDLVLREKAATVKKSGILEYTPATVGMESIGGLEVLKKWLSRRSKAFSKKAREFGLPLSRGAMMIGVPGCGKSLSAKAASGIMGVPLIRFDISRVFGGLVGQSEEQMRMALNTIDAIGPSVVWMDEIEKAFAGAGGSGSNDGGVTRRVFGTFLTWAQEKTTPSFLMATCNSIEGLPPEFLRKGRWDENFYVGPPNLKARVEIAQIQLKNYGRGGLGLNCESIAAACDGYTGAEIEQAVKEGLFTAFDQDRELLERDVVEALLSTNPIVKSMKEQLSFMTNWAKENAVNASLVDEKDPYQGGRILAL